MIERLGRAFSVGFRRDAIKVGVHAVGDEHLGAVEDVAVALAAREGADAFHVGAGIRLGDGDRGDDLAGDDAGHPFVLLRLAAGAEDVDRGHVGMNERGNGDARKGRAAELFGQHHGRERIHLRAAVARRIADAEKAQAAHAAQHLARHVALLLPGERVRLDLGLDEAAHLRAQHLMLFREIRRPARRGVWLDVGDLIHRALPCSCLFLGGAIARRNGRFNVPGRTG